MSKRRIRLPEAAVLPLQNRLTGILLVVGELRAATDHIESLSHGIHSDDRDVSILCGAARTARRLADDVYETLGALQEEAERQGLRTA